MLHEFQATATMLLLTATALGQTELTRMIHLTVHPQGPPVPALKYHLLPDLAEQKPGDAGPLYRRAAKAVELARQKGNQEVQWDDQLATWQREPPKNLLRAEVRRFLEAYQDVFRTLEEASRCHHCNWDLVPQLRQRGNSTPLIEEIRSFGHCTSLLAVRARLAMAEGKLDLAFRDLKTGFVLARRLGEAPTLFYSLAAFSVTRTIIDQLDEFIQQPRAPNLYWALTDLPRPFIDLRKAFQGERILIYGSFPGLGEAAGNLHLGPLSEPKARELANSLRKQRSPDWFQDYLERVALSRQILNQHDEAKRVLIEQGRPRALVEAMPHVQVAVLHGLHKYDRLIDEFIKWQSFPYWDARPHLSALRKRLEEERPKKETCFDLSMVSVVLPDADKVIYFRTKLDRRIAALRCVEALRLHAAANEGQLAASLEAVRAVPIPVDPVTGKSFVYNVVEGRAILRGPSSGAESPITYDELTYELSLAR